MALPLDKEDIDRLRILLAHAVDKLDSLNYEKNNPGDSISADMDEIMHRLGNDRELIAILMKEDE